MSIIGVDTGGTFTDLVGKVGDAWHRLKIPSTPEDPAQAVVEGVRTLLRRAEGDAEVVGGRGELLRAGARARVVHGSTVATNALLERTGARTALVTNRGFEDLLEIGRQNRPRLYALRNERPPPLVAPADRAGVSGRLGPTGEVEQPLDPVELEALAHRLAGVEAVAVCLLHGYADPSQERRIGEALEPLGVPITLASELVPEFREYERLSTAVVNAYVMPLMGRYLAGLDRSLGSGSVSVMGSGGGWLGVERAAKEPVRTVLSGPAGGVLGARAVAVQAGFERILTLDMGGTSTDVAVCPGEPLRTREARIGDQPLAIDVLDIHTIGSGGGSIAWVDPAGALRVGPRSAGAMPGPACYGHGGERATVTDANVVLGRLPVDAFRLDGRPLDADAADAALDRLAARLAVSSRAAAVAVVDAVDAAMEAALRLVSVERGYDPREFTLVAFGGAAGLHAASLADRIGVSGVLLPPDPGILSAYGMVVAPARKDASRSVLWTASRETEAAMARVFAQLDADTRSALVRDGIAERTIGSRRWVHARYVGQSHELRVPAEGWVERFHTAHEAAFGYRRPEDAVQAVTLRVEALGQAGDGRAGEPLGTVPDGAPVDDATSRQVRVASGEGDVTAAVLERSRLRPGDVVGGPAILREYTSTTWVPPGWVARALPTLAVELARA
ncbi:MAG TPA: hydantoinase/oxoprolinase family protein [Longimicrobiales bacterium]|nr:hydantoinase/oxoprolinase family protein [Longimicrobiales bacterium]